MPVDVRFAPKATLGANDSYHSVGGGEAAIATETFRGHLGVIAARGQILTLRKIVDFSPDRGIAVAITFDDGYATLRDRGSAVLKDFGCVATAFLNVSEIADEKRRSSSVEHGYYPGEQFLTWRDVEVLLAEGCISFASLGASNICRHQLGHAEQCICTKSSNNALFGWPIKRPGQC